MSIGYGAFCKKESENDEFVTYAYSSYNWNDERYYNDERVCDGKIIISKKVVSDELSLHSHDYLGSDFTKLYDNGDIIVKNSSNTWMKHSKGMDVMAIHLCFKLLNQYQKEYCFPDECHYLV